MSSQVSIRLEMQDIPTYAPGPDNPYPDFGWAGSHWERYPYSGKPDLSNVCRPMPHRVVVLENKYVRVSVLPDVGGRIFSFYDKTAGQEAFMTPPSLKFQHIAQRGAWLAGGVEFNSGYHHHTVNTVSPVTWAMRQEPDGEASLWVGTITMPVESRWSLRISLKPDRAAVDLEIHTAGPEVLPGLLYWWTNAAVEVGEQSRFYYFGRRASYHTWPIYNGLDFSWWHNRLTGSDMFLQECGRDYMGFYDFGRHHGVANTTDRFEAPGQKYFTWGTHQLGRYWDQMFSDSGQSYCEIQRGRHPTQGTNDAIAPMTEDCWSETWLPLNNTEGFSATENDLVLSVTQEGQKAVIRLTALRPMAGLTVQASADETPLGQWSVASLSPEAMFKQEAALPAGKKCDRLKVTDSAGKTLMDWEEYQYVLDDESTTNPPPLHPAASNPETAESIFANAQWARYWNWPRPNEQVRKDLQRVLTLDSGHAGALRAMAEIAFHDGRYEEAAGHVRKALERFAADGDLRVLLGWCLLRQGQTDAAAEEFATAARAEPCRRRGLTALAQAHLAAGRAEQAGAALDRLLTEFPTDKWGRYFKVIVLRKSGQAEQAKALLKELLAQDPIWHRLHAEALLLGVPVDLAAGSRTIGDDSVSAAMPYIQLGLWQDAAAILEIDESNEPFSPALRLAHLAYVQEQMYEPSETLADLATAPAEMACPWETPSIEILQELCQNHPDKPMLQLMLGNLLAGRERIDEAGAAWEKAAALGMTSPVLTRNLAVLAKHRGQKDQAWKLYRRAWSKTAKNDVSLYVEIDRFLAATGRHQERLDLYGQLPKKLHERSMIAHRRVAQLLDLAQWEPALDEISKRQFFRGEHEFAMRGNYVEAILGMALARLAAGDVSQAQALLKRGLEYPRNTNVGRHGTMPGEAMVYYFLGLAAEMAGQAQQARDYYHAAVTEYHQDGTIQEGYEMLAYLALGMRPRAMFLAGKIEQTTRQTGHWAGSGMMRFMTGLVMLGRGHIDRPREIWRKTLEEFPDTRFVRLHLDLPDSLLDKMRRQPAQTI